MALNNESNSLYVKGNEFYNFGELFHVGNISYHFESNLFSTGYQAIHIHGFEHEVDPQNNMNQYFDQIFNNHFESMKGTGIAARFDLAQDPEHALQIGKPEAGGVSNLNTFENCVTGVQVHEVTSAERVLLVNFEIKNCNVGISWTAETTLELIGRTGGLPSFVDCNFGVVANKNVLQQSVFCSNEVKFKDCNVGYQMKNVSSASITDGSFVSSSDASVGHIVNAINSRTIFENNTSFIDQNVETFGPILHNFRGGSVRFQSNTCSSIGKYVGLFLNDIFVNDVLNNSFEGCGINAYNVKGTFSHNSIKTYDQLGHYPRNSGLKVTASPDLWYCNNDLVNENGTAVHFTSNNMNSGLYENKIGNAKTGLYIDFEIGEQEHRGNSWTGQYGHLGAENAGQFPEASLFTVNTNSATGGSPLFLPSSFTPPQTFFPEGFGEVNACGSNITGEEDDFTFMEQRFIDGFSTGNEVETEVLRRELYKKLKENPTLIQTYDLEVLFDQLNSSSSAAFYEINQLWANYFDPLPDYNTVLNDYYSLLEGLHPLYVDYAQNPLQSILDQIETLKAEIAAAYDIVWELTPYVEELRTNRLNELSVAIDDVVAATNNQISEKTMNEYLYAHMSDDTHIFNENELEEIRLTAAGCPRQDGHGVLIARTLLPMDEHVNYEDELCGGEELRESKPILNHMVQIYPNPVFNELNIKSDKEISAFKIYNAKGVLVQNGEVNSSSISISKLTSGLYSLECLMADKSIESINFVKQE